MHISLSAHGSRCCSFSVCAVAKIRMGTLLIHTLCGVIDRIMRMWDKFESEREREAR